MLELVQRAGGRLALDGLDALTDQVKRWGGKGLVWMKVEAGGELVSPVAKFLTDPERARAIEREQQAERELGPGVAAALARTADMAREDSDFLDALCADIFKGIAKVNPTWVELPVEFLAEQPPAIRNRLIAQAIAIFGTPTTRVHVLAIAELVTDWHGQKELALPGIRVSRTGGSIHLKSAKTLTPGAC
mgnify:CR=1 FL=1